MNNAADLKTGNLANIEMYASIWNQDRSVKALGELDLQVAYYLRNFSNTSSNLTAAARDWQDARRTGDEHLVIRALATSAKRACERLSVR